MPAAEPVDGATSGSATSRASNLTVSSSAATGGTSTFRQLLVALLLGAVGVAIIGGIWYWQQHGIDEPDSGPSPATLSAPSSDTPTAPSREPARSGPGNMHADNGVAPPTVEIDSLPESMDGADGGTGATALAGTEPARNLGPNRNRRAGRRPNHRSAAAAPKGARSPLPPAADISSQNPECSPPWYIDAKGIQRLKPKCL
jgi:hypothetical protein